MKSTVAWPQRPHQKMSGLCICLFHTVNVRLPKSLQQKKILAFLLLFYSFFRNFVRNRRISLYKGSLED